MQKNRKVLVPLVAGSLLLSVVLIRARTPAITTPPAEAVAVRDRPAQGQDSIRSGYPKSWEVSTPAGSVLDSLRRQLARQTALLPARDLEDRTPLPIWFRVYLRRKHPDLPTAGPYQYPRTATALLRWMLAHPDSVKP
jgi:hypothetical protein